MPPNSIRRNWHGWSRRARATINLRSDGGAILADVTVGALPIKTGDGTLGDSVLSEDADNVIVQGKLLSVRRSAAAAVPAIFAAHVESLRHGAGELR